MKADLIHYLSFNGNCAEAMQFYKDALDRDLSVLLMRDSPYGSAVAA